ncbi:hypothetical protein PG994_007484 [Apiospora phragmitis]|uniref:Uncharacterized protein n=1 Tax=Apiospora phragmitis TaxID=2905665 RepID=A0ABR1V0W6_9PEZI
MARKQQRPKDMDPAVQFGFPQFGMPYGASNSHHMPFPIHPYSAFNGLTYVNPNGAPFVVHPFASSGDHSRPGYNEVVARKGNITGDAVKTSADTTNASSPEMQVSRAAHKLHKQSDNILKSYGTLHEDYETDTKPISDYVQDRHLLQQIWRLKVEKFQEDKTKKEQQEQPAVQRAKLASCLNKMDTSAEQLLLELASDESQHDSRTTLLEKLRQAGDRVRDLTDKASTCVDAHKDLVGELKSIGMLTDPKSSALCHSEKPKADSQDQENPQADDSDYE